MESFVHPTAMIEDGVQLGPGTRVYDNVHIRHHAVLGEQCLVGGKTLIAYEVQIGNRVKINSNVYICYGVTLEDGVMISAGTIFTNDRFPRATTPDLLELRSSDPDEETRQTLVRQGATIGAGCIIGSDLTIGQFAMIGMGSVVTRSVPDFHLVIGNPARSIAAVCRCGPVTLKFDAADLQDDGGREVTCQHCQRRYHITPGRTVSEVVSEAVPCADGARRAENQA